jgi:hypothetical protein
MLLLTIYFKYFQFQRYANAGAFIQEDMSEASVIFGVKQVPIDSLQRDKTFCFFSHTIKVCFLLPKNRKQTKGILQSVIIELY